jgi:hypothetical protein
MVMPDDEFSELLNLWILRILNTDSVSKRFVRQNDVFFKIRQISLVG